MGLEEALSRKIDERATKPDRAAARAGGPLLEPRAIFLLVAFVLILGGFFSLGLHRYFSLAFLDENLDLIRGWVESNARLAIFAFVLTYAFAVVAFPPSGTAMTLLGGFIFGTVAAGCYVVVGATLGATLLFVIAKTTLGKSLEVRAGPWLKKLEAGFQRDAFTYLMILRLIPLFPFWLVNIAPAFLGVRLRTFVLATLIGIIPGTFVYASVGSGLSRLVGAEAPLSALAGVEFLAPAAGLLVLALLPMIYKRLTGR